MDSQPDNNTDTTTTQGVETTTMPEIDPTTTQAAEPEPVPESSTTQGQTDEPTTTTQAIEPTTTSATSTITSDPTTTQAPVVVDLPTDGQRAETSTTQNVDNEEPVDPLISAQPETQRAIGKFTHIKIGDVNHQAFLIFYDSHGGAVDKEDQLVLVDEEVQKYFNVPGVSMTAHHTESKYTKITTRTHDDIRKYVDYDGYFYIEYQIGSAQKKNLLVTRYPTISITDRRYIPLITDQHGQIRKYKTCCKTHYLIVSDKHKCHNGLDRLEPRNVDNISYYKHCREITFSYISLQLLGFCECTVHVDSIGCRRKHCC